MTHDEVQRIAKALRSVPSFLECHGSAKAANDLRDMLIAIGIEVCPHCHEPHDEEMCIANPGAMPSLVMNAPHFKVGDKVRIRIESLTDSASGTFLRELDGEIAEVNPDPKIGTTYRLRFATYETAFFYGESFIRLRDGT